MAKPQGGPHREERKKLLEKHGQTYVQFKAGKITERDLYEEVAELQAKGIPFWELVEARDHALRGIKKSEGGLHAATA